MRTVNSYLAPCSLKKWHNDIHSSNLSFLCLEKMGMGLRMKLISVSRARIEKKNANLISIQQLLKWNYPPPTWARQKTLKKSKQLIGLVPNIVSKKSVLNKQSNVRPV